MKQNLFLFLLAILWLHSGAIELPTDPSQWQSSTQYQLTTDRTLSSSATLPSYSTLTITNSGRLALTGSGTTLTCAEGSTIIVSGGEVELVSSGTALVCENYSRIKMIVGELSLSSINTTLRCSNGSSIIMSDGTITLLRPRTSLICDSSSYIKMYDGQILLRNSSATVTCIDNSGIIVSGGSIDGVGKLVGQNATFSAPIMPVIDPNITIEGEWRMARAYPQWFAVDDCDDWSEPINKAINMKGTGEVFLPRGNYPVKHTIYVNFGIQLVGEGGRNKETQDPTRVSASVIHPVLESQFDDEFMVKVNIEKDSTSWSVNHPIPGTELRDLYFYVADSITPPRGILAAGGLTVDQVTWNGTKQAVAFLPLYSDQRRITYCTYYPHHIVGNDTIYAFDLNCLGDAVVFEGNHVSNYRVDRPALRINETGGATIVSNILNSDVEITTSKAVYFGANHCETGAQVRCICSTVKFENNFYEKGDRPSVLIKGNIHNNSSVVSMDGEMFGYYNGTRWSENRSESIARLESISEYDIGIDRHSQLSLNNTYRYDIHCNNGAGMQYTYGINVAKVEQSQTQTDSLSTLTNFFAQSHILSASGRIQLGYKIVRSIPLSSPGSANIYEYGPAGLTTWFGQQYQATDTLYHYVYLYKIYGEDGATEYSSGELNHVYENSNTPIRLGLPNEMRANLMCVSQGESSGNQLKVKFTRLLYYDNGVIDSKTVTVPLSGVNNLYDNGIAICGYKWKDVTE